MPVSTLTSGDVMMGTIVNRISEVAGKQRMQVSDLAKEAKVSYDTVKRLWYATSRRLDLSTLASICEALDCQPGDLFTYVDNSHGRDQ